MTARLPRPLLLAAAALVAACNDSTGNDPVTPGPVPETWVADAGVRLTTATSSSTVQLANGSWRTYLPLGGTATSPDGLAWTRRPKITLPEEPTFNPAVLRLPDGTFLMIYEAGHTTSSLQGGKFYRATSTDGATFTKTPGALAGGAVLVPTGSDENVVSVPDLIQLADGRLRLYFVAKGDHVQSAVSSDLGFTWTREGRTTIRGLERGRWVLDPDILQLASGFRLYFASGPGGSLDNKRILSATSSDGLTFLLDEGERIGVPDETTDLVDPDVVRLPGGGLRMYYGYTANPAGSTYDLVSAATQ